MNWYRKSSIEEDLIKEIAKKIIEGNKEWTPEELQIQQNCPEALEEILRQYRQ
jgi:hypothetical protein